MQLSLDLRPGTDGTFAVEAYDLPERTTPSTTFTQPTADLYTNSPPPGEDVTRLVLTEALLTRHARAALARTPATYYVYLYRPVDRRVMLEFERRIEPRYGDYYAELGVFYAGLFDVVDGADGADGAANYVAEIIAFDRSLDEAKRFVEEYEPAPDIAAVEDECRTLQNREVPRHLFWLTRRDER